MSTSTSWSLPASCVSRGKSCLGRSRICIYRSGTYERAVCCRRRGRRLANCAGLGQSGARYVRALKMAAPRHVQCVEVADPRPGRGEVLVRIDACGVCGSDLNAWRGVPGVEFPLAAGAPGHETWGRVVGLGADVADLQVGERVTGLMWNGFAELGTAAREDLLLVPANLGDDPLLGEPLACATNVVQRSGIAAGDRVAIVGFGYLAALVAHLLPENAAE